MTQQQSRMMNNDELAVLVKLMRDSKKWTQEQLAEISNLNIRTIQRVENGTSASFDTRRALARAFDASDIDCFNKAHVFPTQKEIEDAIEKAEKEHLTLDANDLKNGRHVGQLAEWSGLDMCTCDYELPSDVQQAYAELLDYFRDFRDSSDFFHEVDKLKIYDDFNDLLRIIELSGFCMKYAKREVSLVSKQGDDNPIPMKLLYMSIFPKQQAPSQFMVARKINFQF
jgi:transcriptional regulator with XRE-family HTH domain